MGHTTTVVRFPGSGDEDRDQSSVTSMASTAPTRLTARLRGVDREEDLARALDAWRPLGGLTGDGARFVLSGRLGQGSQGVVFALRDRDAQRIVALKTLNGRDVERDDVSRFLHEVQITAQLEHPGVVPVHDVGVLPDGTVFYFMKRVEGVVLTDWLAGRAGSPEHRFEVIQLFLKICDTMAFAHSRGVVHRDLKPRNVMVGTYGEVLVMDWGLAKVIGAAEPLLKAHTDVQLSSMADHETIAGTAVGTPAYMSPEQARGQLDRVDHRSDIYGLGVLLYEMLAAASPYQRGDLRRTVAQVVGGQWKPIDQHQSCRDLPRRLSAIVHKAMAHSQDDRYQHVSELASDLRSFLAGEAVSAYRETFADLAARLIDRHRRTIAWASVGVLAVAAVSGMVWWHLQSRDASKVEELRAEVARAVADGAWAQARQASEQILAYRPGDREARDSATRFDERVKSEAERQAREDEQARNARQKQLRAAQLREQAAAAASRGGIDDLDEALTMVKSALELHPTDTGLAADYERWFTALAALRTAREQAAEAETKRRQRHDSAMIFTARAIEVEQAGDLEAAIGALSSAIELEPDPARVDRLGVLAAKRRELLADQERALRELEQRAAREARRAEADGQLRAADEALAANQPARARGCVERAGALVADHPGLADARRRVETGLRLAVERSAEALLEDATRANQAVASLRQVQAARDEDTRRLRQELGESGDPARRVALAAAEDASLAAERESAARVADCIGLLNRALALAPGHPPVRAALASFWVERLAEAEAAGDLAAAAASVAQAGTYDDGAHRDLLAGVAWVVNRGAIALRLTTILRQADRTEAPVGTPVEVAAGSRVQVMRGRYLVESADGVRTAIAIERGSTRELRLPALPAGLAAGERFVPGGTLRDESGRALEEIAPFACMEREVTCGEWLEFVNDRAISAQIDAALSQGYLIFVPRDSAYYDKDNKKGMPRWKRRSEFLGRGGWVLEEDKGGARIDPGCPVSEISHDDAVAYAAWRASRDGRPWRLPSVQEWQLAVQGGDGRAYPWGSAADLAFCASLARDATTAGLPGGRHPTDRSVQGVLDLAGSRSEFCAGRSQLSPELRPLLGGNITERLPDRFTAWSRRDYDRRLVHPGWGVRLVFSP